MAEDEFLIGCKLDYKDRNEIFGATWIKMKVPQFGKQYVEKLKLRAL
jgi:hypothetical protein